MGVHDASVEHAVFGCRADASYLSALATTFLLDTIASLVGAHPPEVISFHQPYIIVYDMEVHRRGGLSAYDQPVVAGKTQLRSPETPGVRLPPQAGKRRSSAHGEAPAGRCGSADQRPSHEDQRVLWPQGISSGGDHIIEVATRQTTAPHVPSNVFLIEGLGSDSAVGEIDCEEFPHVSMHVLGTSHVLGNQWEHVLSITGSDVPSDRTWDR